MIIFFKNIDCTNDKKREIFLLLKEIKSDLSKISNKYY